MDAKTLIKQALLYKGMKMGDLARLLNYDESNIQTFYNLVSRNKMTVNELRLILSVMGYDIVLERISG